VKEKHIYILLSIALSIGLADAIYDAIPSIYILRSASYTNGVVTDIKTRNSIDADLSFDYYIDYVVEQKKYKTIYTKSITKDKYSIGDSILIKYANKDPKYSIVSEGDVQKRSLLFVIIIFFALIFTIISSFRSPIIRSVSNK
jgi:hypothetical protein